MQIRDPDFDFIRQLVYDQSSIHLGEEKKEMVCTRLSHRLSSLGLASVEEYCDLLKSNREPDEIVHLIDALSTNFTNFFREIEHFKFFKETIIPEFLSSFRPRIGPFRAWSAACSTGEEAYSMAIVLDSSLQGINPTSWQIFASDISTRVLEKAADGIYEGDHVKLPNPAWLPRYFQKGKDHWKGFYRVKQHLREKIEFAHMNLLEPTRTEDRYHVIFCRNVMIYFDEPTTKTLVERLYHQLHQGGYLIIGHSESLGERPSGAETNPVQHFLQNRPLKAMKNLTHQEWPRTNPIRVLSVDDSPIFRKSLTDLLGHHPDIALVGYANDPYEARDRMRSLPIDVLIIDLDLPRMPGLQFLKLVMERKPMPVIVLSSDTPPGSPKTVEAFLAGAFAVIEKPAILSDREGFGEKLIQEIKSAAAAPLRRYRTGPLHRSHLTESATLAAFNARQIIALGASTGGTQALEMVLTMLPDNLPGIVVVQHIPAGFSTHFAARLDRACAMEVREAKHGDVVTPGLALIAPGDQHMEIRLIRDQYRVALHGGPLVEHQRPSVDVLFHSLAKCAGPHTVAALLTGMGRDGAAGMKQLHDLNAHTLVQDAGSSVVYGMARKAVELKAVNSIVPLEDIADEIVKALQNHNSRTHPKSYVSK